MEVIVPNQPRSYDDITYILPNIERKKLSLNLKEMRPKLIDKQEAPESIGKILWIKVASRNSVYLSIGGFYSGYIHEYDFNRDASYITSVCVENGVDVTSLIFM